MSALSEAGARLAFVDSSAYFALGDVGEERHGAARSILTRMTTERWRLVTTNFVVAETHGLVLNRRDRLDALRFLRQFDGSTTVIRADSVDERFAREIIERYDDKEFSLTDAISFAVMERLGIGHAFTFDRHFAQYGFVLLEPNDP